MSQPPTCVTSVAASILTTQFMGVSSTQTGAFHWLLTVRTGLVVFSLFDLKRQYRTVPAGMTPPSTVAAREMSSFW